MHPYPEHIVERFHTRYAKSTEDECWMWKGTKFIMCNSPHKYYGRLDYRYDGKRYCLSAHRMSWNIHNSTTTPSSIFICHKCGNSLCVNPHHLYEGNHLRNMEDMIRHGNSQKGSRHWNVKLTEEDILAIRQAREQEQATWKELAEKYDLHEQSVVAIVGRRRWKHI